MSFGGNPPWQRNSLGNSNQQNAIANLQSQMNFVGFQNLAMAQQTPQNNIALMPSIGANIGTLNNTNPIFTNQHQTIQYQNARSGLNPNAFGSVQSAQNILQQNPSQNQGNQSTQMCNKIGTITKFQNNNFGFIDDEIIFHKNTFKGQHPPKIGDRVLFDATFNNNSAYKWNATIVQLMSSTNQAHNLSQNQLSGQIQSQQQQSQQQPQQQQQSRNFAAFNSMPSPQGTFSGSLERAGNSARNSNHSSRPSPPPRRTSAERSSRRDDDDRRRREKERERERER